MPYPKRILLAIFILICSKLQSQSKDWVYPYAPKDDISDTYWGVTVRDPYRWLEYDSLQRTSLWVKEQNELTQKYMDVQLKEFPLVLQLHDLAYFDFGSLHKEKDYFFNYVRYHGFQNPILEIKRSTRDEGAIAIDPFDYGPDARITDFKVSGNRKKLAFQISYNGSDLNEIRVKKIYPFQKLPDIVRGVRFSSICWKGEGFFYCQYESDQSNNGSLNEVRGPKLYYHRLGTDQAQDILVYENKETARVEFNVIEKESFLIVRTTERLDGKDFGCLLYFDIKDSITKKYTNFLSYSLANKNEYNLIGFYKNKFLVFTNDRAPRGRLILVDPYPPFERSIFIPQKAEVLNSASIIGDKVVCSYLKDIDFSLLVFDTNQTEINNIPFPVGALVDGFQGTSEDSTTVFWYTSLLNPPIAYKYNSRNNSFYLIKTTVVKYDVNDFEIFKVYSTSKDGTKIPIIIAKKKGVKLNGKLPTILYGYGGYGAVITSFFDKGFINHLHNNGVVAVAALRGGGEYGREWHENGSGANKQNSIDDFISAAEYLVSENFTSKEKLAIMGGSNGGLLVSAVVNQRPDICKVVVGEVGIYDLLRFNKYTIGKSNEGEFGSVDDSLGFNFLYKYSPIHNISDSANYPATLIITADHDDRAVPMHSYKYAATLQAKNKSNNPILLYTVKNQGHYFLNDQIESYIYAFIYKNLGLKRKDVSYMLE